MKKLKLRHLSVAVGSALLLGFGANAMADSTKDIVNALVAKGVLTEEEGDLLAKGRNMEQEAQSKKEKKSWTNNIKINGYVQNRVTTMMGGDDGAVLWPDPSVGDDDSGSGRGQNFRIRRARIIFSGQVGDHLGFYIQPDFASAAGSVSALPSNTGVSTSNNITQLRDAYGDIFIDKDKVHRIRVGQSKVPFGYENLQSSSNRLALDRVDALNSAVRDERDTGAFYYYTPKHVQDLFKEITDAGLKHTGNYGMFALGAYMGQGANQNDANDNYHVVSRFTYPWKTSSGQIFEAGIQAYKGKYVRSSGNYMSGPGLLNASATTVIQGAGASSANVRRPTIDAEYRKNGSSTTGEFDDERLAVSFRMYPQPWGLEAEWNWGTSPGLDVAENKIKNGSLHGGYVQGSYFAKDVNLFNYNIGTVIPFVKWQYYDGFNKAETNAPKNNVNDWELGLEWQIAPEVELVAVYHKMKRTNMTTSGEFNNLNGSYKTFDADALRLQLQYNFF
jgi:phosphate-selective porin/polyhydroxyalkanoate synthesis regulator phasin